MATSSGVTPAVTVIIQYFRHPHTLAALLLRLLSDPRVEVIAHSDSHTKADSQAFSEAVANYPPPALRIIYSQNVHELRAYNKAAVYARAPLLLFTQDDHLPPASPTAWMNFVVHAFELLGPGGLDALGLTSARVCAGGLPFVGRQKCIKLGQCGGYADKPLRTGPLAFVDVRTLRVEPAAPLALLTTSRASRARD